MIRLRNYSEKDLDRHLDLFLMNDIKVNKNVRKQEEKWLKKVIRNNKKVKPLFYTSAIIVDRKLIGNVIAEKISKNKLHIGFWIGKDYWNKGYSTKALGMFLRKIIKKFKIKKIYAETKKNNFGSRKVLEKNEFVLLAIKNGMCEFVKET